jgi:peptidoglycan-associated lipoprotein
MITKNHAVLTVAALATLSLSACGNVKRKDYDADMATLRANDTSMRNDITALQGQMANLTRELDAKFAHYDSQISELSGRVRVDLAAHFDYDAAMLRDADKPALDDFAGVLRNRYPDVVVTVEGFTDPAGSPTYNQKLGLKRAEAVRDYLVSSGGLPDTQVRAVSYGEARNRQVSPGAWGDDGAANRRVSLVIDYVTHPGSSAPTT